MTGTQSKNLFGEHREAPDIPSGPGGDQNRAARRVNIRPMYVCQVASSK